MAVGILAAALMTVLPAVVAGVPAAFAQGSCADSWTNSAGGLWIPTSSGTDANWSTGAPPTASQSACITIALSAPVVLNSGTGVASSLTLGGTSGSDELELTGATLTLASASTVSPNGTIVFDDGVMNMEAPSVLTNEGTISIAGSSGGVAFYGDVTNAPDGFVSASQAMYVETGTFTNRGELSIASTSTVNVPYSGGGSSAGAVLDNAGGTIQNQGFINVNPGGTFEEGAGTVVGVPATYNAGIQITGGALDLVGKGASSFDLAGGGGATLSGNIAADQTVFVDATVYIAGSITNDGNLIDDGGGELSVPAGDTLTNAGSIVVPPANNFELAGNLLNEAKGRIAVAPGSAGGSTLTLEGAVTLTNDGTISVGTSSNAAELSAGSAGTIDNAGGTIANAGTVQVDPGATFVEGKGKTTGKPVVVTGSLDLTGQGASSFQLGGTLSGNVAAGQTVELGLGLGNAMASGSFTNAGTLMSDGSLALPYGDTLTNKGTIEFGQGTNLGGLTLYGNLTNAAGGVLDGDGGTLQMGGLGTTFDNAGTLDLLYQGNIRLDDYNTFDNTGTVYWGVNSDGAQWGSGAYASDFTTEAGDTVDLGGRVVPVPDGEPSGGTGTEITYGLGLVDTCGATVTSGWSLSCSGDNGDLVESESSTLEPTEVTVTGSGTSESYGRESSYGQPVTLSATVSAQAGATPTGKVAFYAAQQYTSSTYDPTEIPPDLVGSAKLSTSGGVTKATLTTSKLPPGEFELLAEYSGDAADLAASTVYSGTDEQVVEAQSTTVGVASAPASPVFGDPVTLSATVTPGAYGPAKPTGVVTFFYGSTVIGWAPVATKAGVTTAKFTTTSLPAGSDSVTASYSGDYDYGGATSSAHSVSVASPTAPSTVTVTGPSSVAAGASYKATASTDGTGAVLYVLASNPAPPAGMTIGGATGQVSLAVPDSGTSSFSFAVVASNAAGQAESSVVTVTVS